MGKRTITFSIEIEDNTTDNSFIDNLIDEVAEDKRQLEITHKINKETTNQHRLILIGLVDELNSQLNRVGLRFGDYRFSDYSANRYLSSHVKCVIGKNTIILMISGRSGHQLTNKFTESKYTTYTGEYDLKMGFDSENNVNTTVLNLNMILNHIKHNIKEHIKENPM